MSDQRKAITRTVPRVSIIVPIYNVEEYLPECLDSVQNQVYANLEIICVDDGSTDGSPAILQQYAAADPRIKILTQPNGGAGRARNTGLSAVTGQYVFFCDPDDQLVPDTVSRAVAAAEKAAADVVIFRHTIIDMVTRKKKNVFFSKKLSQKLNGGLSVFAPRELSECLFDISHAVWDKCFRTSFVREHQLIFQELYRTNDLYFSDMAVLQAGRIALLNKSLYCYRTGQLSTTKQDRLAGTCLVGFAAVKEYMTETQQYWLYEKSFIEKMVTSLRYEVSSVASYAVFSEIFPEIRKKFLEIIPPEEFQSCQTDLSWSCRKLYHLLLSYGDPYVIYYSVNAATPSPNTTRDERMLTLLPFRTTAPLDDPAAFPDTEPVAVIIPVYNAFECLVRLTETLFRNTAPIHEIIFIDDVSTDERVRPFLKELAGKHANVRVVFNQENHGFSYNVNLGAAMTKRDFVILNTDTVVPDRWIPRLFAPMRALPDTTASVNPMGTDSLVLTIPKPCLKSQQCGIAFVQSFGFERLDRAISSVQYDFETSCTASGLGFAMAISRKVWDEIGGFAGEVFGRGYHEETDWSLRAWRAGYAARIAANLLIPHLHDGRSSFTQEQKKELLMVNEEPLRLRNPEFDDKKFMVRFKPGIARLRIACRKALQEYGIGYATDGVSDRLRKTYQIENSVSYRIGRAITWGPRVVRRIVRCWRENGFSHTLKRIFSKLKNFFRNWKKRIQSRGKRC